jgi:Flp pilus assembly protein TadD
MPAPEPRAPLVVCLALASFVCAALAGCGGAPGGGAPAAGPAPPAAPSVETGFQLLRHGDFRGAEPHLAWALRQSPRDPRILAALGTIYARTDRFQKAEESFRAALAIVPDSVPARLGLSAVLIDSGRYDEAQEALSEVRRRDPENAGALLKWALLQARRGQPGEAKTAARQVIARQPGSAEAHYVLGLALLQEGALEEAAAALRRAQELAPGHLGALSNLVKIETRLGHREEALRWRRAHDEALARTRIEEKVRGHRLKGVEAFNSGDFPTALQEFLAIARDDPGDPQVHLHLGSTYLALGRREEARASLEHSLSIEPRNERALAELGRLQALDNHLDEAVETLRRAIAVNPEYAEPHYYLAGIYMARGEPDLYRQEMQRYEGIRSRSGREARDDGPASGKERP